MSSFKKQASSLLQSSSAFPVSSVKPSRSKRTAMDPSHELQAKESFELFDPHRTNHITYHQMKVILRALGFDVKKSEVVAMARQFDVEESGRIAFDDYMEIMRRKYAERDPIEETLKAFKLFDETGKGRIGLNDLKRVAKELGETLKQEELIAMIEEFDHDGDGCINEEEFLSIIKPALL